MTTSMPRIATAACVAALSLVLAGCGGSTDEKSSDSGSASSSPTESPSTPAPTTVELTAKPYGKAPDMTPMKPADATTWQGYLDKGLASPEAKGATAGYLAVSVPGKGFWVGTSGTTSKGGPETTLADTSRIGSVSKTFTATAVLEQVEAGRLALDDTVEKVLPDLATQFPATAAITVDQLLRMNSGLPDYANVKGGAFTQSTKETQKVWTPEELIASALDTTKPSPPGTPGYTTTGIIILGLMLEEVTGDPAEEVLTQVAKDAGLEHTALTAPEDNAMPEPFAHGYQDKAGVASMKAIGGDIAVGTDTTDWNISSLGASGGGMYSTIGDLFNWAVTGSGTSLLSPATAKTRVELTTPIEGDSKYGQGIMDLSVTRDMVGHTGQTIGYTALELHNPDTGATVALMVNSTEGITPVLVQMISEIVLM